MESTPNRDLERQKRVISGPSAMGICIASTIGSGIFTVTGVIGPELVTTNNLMIGWIVGGLVAICGGLAVAELAAMRPEASAQYVVVHEALGPSFGYLKGMITLLIGYISALAAVAMIAGSYIQNLLPGLDPRVTATLLLASLGGVQAITVLGGQRFNDLLVAFKVILIVAFIGVGLAFMGDPLLPSAEVIAAAKAVDPESVLATVPIEASPREIDSHLRDAVGPSIFSGVMGLAIIMISFAYLGWSTAAEVAGEIRRPGRNLPIAIIGSVVLIGVLYLLMNIVYTSAIPPSAMVELDSSGALQPMADIGSVVATHILGDKGGMLVTGAIVFLMISTLSTGLMTGGRTIAAMSWRGELPKNAGLLNRNGAPTVAIVSMLAVTIPIVWSSTIASLFSYVGLLTTIAMMLAMISVIVMRARNPELPRPFKIPLYPIPPIISLGIGGWLVTSAAMEDWLEVVITAVTIIVVMALRPVLTSGMKPS